MRLFFDRVEAGRQLAELCRHLHDAHPLVLGLPRGGVVVGFEVARALGAPLEVWVAHEVGVPMVSELALGAVSEGGVGWLNTPLLDELGFTEDEVRPLVEREAREVAEQVERYRGSRPAPELAGHTVLLVDDGLATGAAARAALLALRASDARRVVLAVPLAASQALDALEPLADEVVCVHASPALQTLGRWYAHFEPVSDEEVQALLERARSAPAGAPARDAAARSGLEREVHLSLEGAALTGTLARPPGARGLALLAHAGGRHGARDVRIAQALQRRGLATLRLDLLTPAEAAYDEAHAALRFDRGLLGRRLAGAVAWARRFPATAPLRLGLLGAGAVAAAALRVAAAYPDAVGAVVSRGGRPDLASESLGAVRAPTLLLVGGRDAETLAVNREALDQLGGPAELVVVTDATHLFVEPGALEAVGRVAADFFGRHLAPEAGEPTRAP